MSQVAPVQPMQPVLGPNAAHDWWKSAVVYQVYPRSFADSNGDGIGDLRGVIDRLDYIADLGVDAVWFSPFYPSPQHDHGYDVADYFDVNPEYGTLEQFTRVIDGAHSRGMRVLIDMVPNHSSSEHQWFKKALESDPGSPERDLYMFRYSGDEAPNNWGSIFGGPAWSRVDALTGKEADQGWWYLHLFDSHQPDFNWDNPHVRDHFEEFLRFWCDLGVDGFRVDVAHSLVKQPGLPDDAIGDTRYDLDSAELISRLERAPYFDQDDVHLVYRRWHEILAEYGGDRMMVGEIGVSDPDRRALYIRGDEMSQAFNFDVLRVGWNAASLRSVLEKAAEGAARVGAASTWVMSNHDQMRHVSRLGYPFGALFEGSLGPTDPHPDLVIGGRRALAMTTFLLGLPGSMYLYNGEELGLPDVQDLPDEARVDPSWERSGHRIYGRDGCRVPLPWSEHPEQDFGGIPWLPMPADWGTFAASLQDQDPDSVLSYYRRALALRRELGLGAGEFEPVLGAEDLVCVRGGGVLAAVNMGRSPLSLPSGGRVLLESSPGACVDGVLAPNAAVWIELER